MKIGIVTVHKAPNYGANLQTYATWKCIYDLGFDAEIIDLSLKAEPPRFPKMRPEFSKKHKVSIKFKMKMLLRDFCVLLHIKKPIYTPPNILPDAQAKFNEFNKLIKYSKKYRSVSELYELGTDYDILITGSDQVWNPQQPWAMEPMFLTFAKENQKKISYASSIGIEDLLPNEKSLFAEWLKSYDAISVRESVAQRLLTQITGRKDIEKVIDPTFLLSQEEWNDFAKKPFVVSPYILVFSLGHNQALIDYALKLKYETGYDVKVICLMPMPYAGNAYESISDACPRELIGYISQAELVLTDSFHGTVFSIIMKAKNFYTYLFLSAKRNSRMIDLLTLFNLKNHILDNELSESYEILESRTIDYVQVSTIINNERERCIRWLNMVLKSN